MPQPDVEGCNGEMILCEVNVLFGGIGMPSSRITSVN